MQEILKTCFLWFVQPCTLNLNPTLNTMQMQNFGPYKLEGRPVSVSDDDVAMRSDRVRAYPLCELEGGGG